MLNDCTGAVVLQEMVRMRAEISKKIMFFIGLFFNHLPARTGSFGLGYTKKHKVTQRKESLVFIDKFINEIQIAF
jgi:hypothetical protein